jgi:hypothetical protein
MIAQLARPVHPVVLALPRPQPVGKLTTAQLVLLRQVTLAPLELSVAT